MAGLHFQYWEELETIHEGAEARVTSGLWLGTPAVLKTRRRRGYRHPDLDSRLTKGRISVEAKILSRLQSKNFPAPRLLELDLEASWMVLTHIEGRPMYDSLLDKSATDEDLEMIGSIIRRLHELGLSLIHI